jgi:hypothetical protein
MTSLGSSALLTGADAAAGHATMRLGEDVRQALRRHHLPRSLADSEALDRSSPWETVFVARRRFPYAYLHDAEVGCTSPQARRGLEDELEITARNMQELHRRLCAPFPAAITGWYAHRWVEMRDGFFVTLFGFN